MAGQTSRLNGKMICDRMLYVVVPRGGSKETRGARPRGVLRVTQGGRNCTAGATKNTKKAEVRVIFGKKDLQKGRTQHQKLDNVPVESS